MLAAIEEPGAQVFLSESNCRTMYRVEKKALFLLVTNFLQLQLHSFEPVPTGTFGFPFGLIGLLHFVLPFADFEWYFCSCKARNQVKVLHRGVISSNIIYLGPC